MSSSEAKECSPVETKSTMECVLADIERGDEERVREGLTRFNEKNASNYKLGETIQVRKAFCSALLSNLAEQAWPSDIMVLALGSLKIFTREYEGSNQLTSPTGLVPLVRLAGLDLASEMELQDIFCQHLRDEQVDVMVEAVKCLCNLVLKNHPLADIVSDMGCLSVLKSRLLLSTTLALPYNVVFFDLRLLFLITACGPEQRIKLRDELSGLSMLVALLDSTLFGITPDPAKKRATTSEKMLTVQVENEAGRARDTSEEMLAGEEEARVTEEVSLPSGDREKEAKMAAEDSDFLAAGGPVTKEESTADETALKPKRKLKSKSRIFFLRDGCFVLPRVMTDESYNVLCEALKIIFNQTINWKQDSEYNDAEVELLSQLAHLLRIIVCSVPLLLSKLTSQTINHCCEVMMNIPQQCHHAFLLPVGQPITPALRALYPTIYQDPPQPPQQGEEEKALLCSNLDQEFEGHGMATGVCLLNYLSTKLVEKIDHHVLSIILSTMSILSKGNRIFRRYFKSKILPPLLEVKERPESGNSLKGRLVRLMTAGAHDCMDMVAEFLFVLCKESPSRLVKHTGYGNAAGLLMAHGLFGGGGGGGNNNPLPAAAPRSDKYSSDSESSDTEEYIRSKPTVDLVTGGPMKSSDESPLANMTPEEIEAEAEKLGHLLEKLQKQGTFKMIPIDKDNKPVEFPKRDREEETDSDAD